MPSSNHMAAVWRRQTYAAHAAVPGKQGSQAHPRDFDQLVDGHWPIPMVLRLTHFDGVFRGFPVVPVETPPRSKSKFRSAGRKSFQDFRKTGPAAPKFRPVDELASPAGKHGCSGGHALQLIKRPCGCHSGKAAVCSHCSALQKKGPACNSVCHRAVP
jgi:hypothetical protein